MKSTLLAIAFLISGSAFARTSGAHIHFQKDSTWVNALYSRTLCLNSATDTYEATISVCVEWRNEDGDRDCVQRGTKMAFQPRVSTRQRCARYSNDDCKAYETVAYVQSPERNVTIYDNEDQVVGTKMVTVPFCAGSAGK